MTVHPLAHHSALRTTFRGVDHTLSTEDAPVVQFRGIQYASVPARFRQSKLVTSYPAVTDASRYGLVFLRSRPYPVDGAHLPLSFSPVCPQIKYKSVEEEMFGCSLDDSPPLVFKQNEFECLNLNITAPAGLDSESRLPVMVWIHGYVRRTPHSRDPLSSSSARGGDRGSGSNWVFDGGALVHKSLILGKPIIAVTLKSVLSRIPSSSLLTK